MESNVFSNIFMCCDANNDDLLTLLEHFHVHSLPLLFIFFENKFI